MLTKDLLKYSIRKGSVKPLYIKTEEPAYRELAEDIIFCFNENIGATRRELEENLEPLTQCKNQLQAKGFIKLLMDRSEFSQAEDLDYPARRQELFKSSANLLKRRECESPEQLRAALGIANVGQLYADLPENDRLVKVRAFTVQQLLDRYNVAQVQGILMHARELTIHTRDQKAANLRRLFKYMNFFRLLSTVKRDEDQSIILTIDGPLSILNSARKYGLQLAVFFPAVCLLDDWGLEASCQLKKKNVQLSLNHKSKLVSHYRNMSAYVPEEVRLFAEHFKEKAKGWQINPETPFLNTDDSEIIFPDFTFVNDRGKTIYLELFHRWHKSRLLPRLRYCIQKGDRPIIIGIDRSIYKGEVEKLLATGVLATHQFFLFNDYPTVNKVMKCLDGMNDEADLFSQGQG